MDETQDGNELYNWLSRLFQSGARMAHVSLKFVKLTWLISVAVLLGGIFFLTWQKDYHWFWSVSYGVVAIIPVIVLTYYHWMLTSVRQAPEQLGSLRDTLIRFQKDHPKETQAVLSHKLSALGRWKTYKLIGKIVKDVLLSAGDVSSLAGNIKTLAAMGNPFFWVILVVSLVVSLVFSSCMIALIFTLNILG